MECRDSFWLLCSFPTRQQQLWKLNSRTPSDISFSSDVSPCSWVLLCLDSWPSEATTRRRLFPIYIIVPGSICRGDSVLTLLPIDPRKPWLLSLRQLLLGRITWCTVGVSQLKTRIWALQHWIDSLSQIWSGTQGNRRRKSCLDLLGSVHWLAADDARKRLRFLNNFSLNSNMSIRVFAKSRAFFPAAVVAWHCAPGQCWCRRNHHAARKRYPYDLGG